MPCSLSTPYRPEVSSSYARSCPMASSTVDGEAWSPYDDHHPDLAMTPGWTLARLEEVGLPPANQLLGDLLLTGRPATAISPDSTLNTIQILVSALNTGGRPMTRPPAPRHQVMPPQPARQRA